MHASRELSDIHFSCNVNSKKQLSAFFGQSSCTLLFEHINCISPLHGTVQVKHRELAGHFMYAYIST